MKLSRNIIRVEYLELTESGEVKHGTITAAAGDRVTERTAEKILEKNGICGRAKSVEKITEVYDIPDEVAAQYRQNVE